VHGEVLLFGGEFGNETDSNQTWTWDGVDWTQRHPDNSPAGRFDAGLAFDPATDQMLLFGGGHVGGGTSGDTWIWDGTNWAQQHPVRSPAARSALRMVSDGSRGEIVLFGGFDPNGFKVYGDTWVWDGRNWTQMTTPVHPGARYDFLFDYMDSVHRSVLFGGWSVPFGDTWSWDGATWTKHHPPTSPSPRGAPAGAFDAAREANVLFGGYDDTTGGFLGDTWTLP
jgi:hypothetical protein